ncbi:outer membrane protein assembly factor BamB family protein [Streptomyces poriticola]|uniref:outer membrane protein assembly factor BamB family protein n=1 Tax=Streptomyces poriticola TaxID=3120506 RepID=UPI002FCE27FD
MTQPPNQPPQPGGFGAPQDPPPSGGFGAPQTPPPPQGAPGTPPPPQGPPPGTPPTPPSGAPQPGYGYPQQPGAAPGPYGQQPGPYNSGPYAQPQQPGPYGQQPGYGYPQPQYPGAPGTPPPGPGSRNPFRNKTVLAIGAAVAALAVIGGTVWAVTAGGDDKKDKKPVAQQSDDPKPSGSGGPVNPGDGSGAGDGATEDLNEGRQPGEARVLWYKEAPDAPGSGADAPGMWVTDETVVKAAYKQLFAFNVDDGKPTWDAITFPQKICSVTDEKTADDKIIVAYMSGASDRAKCNQLQEIDLDTGAKGWEQEAEEGELFDTILSAELTVVGDVLMVARSQSGTAYDITSGKKLYDKKKYGDACFPAGFAGGGDRLLQVASCGAGGNNAHDELQELDPKTGKVKWTYAYKKGWRIERAYSVDPVVIYADNKDEKVWNISTFAVGKVTSQVGVDEDFAPECGWAILDRDLQGCQGVAVADDTLYLPTKATTGANEIVAIGLADGKEKWRVKSPVEEPMLPMQVEGGKLIAYVEPSYDSGGRIVAIPTGGGSHQPAELLQNPQGAADIENSFYSRDIAWADGRFFLSSARLTGNDDAKEKLMLAYGK